MSHSADAFYLKVMGLKTAQVPGDSKCLHLTAGLRVPEKWNVFKLGPRELLFPVLMVVTGSTPSLPLALYGHGHGGGCQGMGEVA